MNGESLLEGVTRGDRLQLAAAGSWTADHAGDLEGLVEGAVAQAKSVRNVVIDMARVERFDTYGAWLLERLVRGS